MLRKYSIDVDKLSENLRPEIIQESNNNNNNLKKFGLWSLFFSNTSSKIFDPATTK